MVPSSSIFASPMSVGGGFRMVGVAADAGAGGTEEGAVGAPGVGRSSACPPEHAARAATKATSATLHDGARAGRRMRQP